MLTITSLSVAYKNKPLLTDISLVLNQGSTHALMGPNGSGKSTLALSLLGYDHYEILAGAVTYNQEDLLSLPTEKRARAGLFLTLQNPPAISGVEIFTFLKEMHRMLTNQALSVAAFKERVYKIFDEVQLDHQFLYRSVHDGFSGGEKKKFEIAQLLLCKPRVAILDEIDSGLDIDSLKNIASLLKQEQQQTGMTLLVITHYPRLLSYMSPDMVHILYKGKIRASDPQLAHQIEERGYDGLLL